MRRDFFQKPKTRKKKNRQASLSLILLFKPGPPARVVCALGWKDRRLPVDISYDMSSTRLTRTRALRVLKEVAEALNSAPTEQRVAAEALSRVADLLGVKLRALPERK